jgi:hypothetical protein
MEMAKILDFNSERLVARVYTLNSKQYKDDVPVFFPSMYMNTGIITPPVINSTSLLFWGPDRQPFLLPIQLTVPNSYVEEGITRLSASPSFIDKLLSLKNVQGGEVLFRSLGNSYLFLKNLGDVEFGTSRLHRINLTSADGAFHSTTDRIRAEIPNSSFYFGPASTDSYEDLRTHFHLEIGETSNNSSELSETDNEKLLDQLMNDQLDNIELGEPSPKIVDIQMGHVFDETGSTVQDEVDGTELFSKQTMKKDSVETIEQLSKGGRKLFKTTDGTRTTTVDLSPNEASLSVERIVNGTTHSSKVGIDKDGNIVCSKDGVTYDLWQVLNWFYEER